MGRARDFGPESLPRKSRGTAHERFSGMTWSILARDGAGRLGVAIASRAPIEDVQIGFTHGDHLSNTPRGTYAVDCRQGPKGKSNTPLGILSHRGVR